MYIIVIVLMGQTSSPSLMSYSFVGVYLGIIDAYIMNIDVILPIIGLCSLKRKIGLNANNHRTLKAAHIYKYIQYMHMYIR